MRVLQTNNFRRVLKRLNKQQKLEVDAAVRTIMQEPNIGDSKVGDLVGVRVYKFRLASQIALLAYSYFEGTLTLTLLALGMHENFYRDLKRNIQ